MKKLIIVVSLLCATTIKSDVFEETGVKLVNEFLYSPSISFYCYASKIAAVLRQNPQYSHLAPIFEDLKVKSQKNLTMLALVGLIGLQLKSLEGSMPDAFKKPVDDFRAAKGDGALLGVLKERLKNKSTDCTVDITPPQEKPLSPKKEPDILTIHIKPPRKHILQDNVCLPLYLSEFPIELPQCFTIETEMEKKEEIVTSPPSVTTEQQPETPIKIPVEIPQPPKKQPVKHAIKYTSRIAPGKLKYKRK